MLSVILEPDRWEFLIIGGSSDEVMHKCIVREKTPLSLIFADQLNGSEKFTANV